MPMNSKGRRICCIRVLVARYGPRTSCFRFELSVQKFHATTLLSTFSVASRREKIISKHRRFTLATRVETSRRNGGWRFHPRWADKGARGFSTSSCMDGQWFSQVYRYCLFKVCLCSNVCHEPTIFSMKTTTAAQHHLLPSPLRFFHFSVVSTEKS